MTTQHQRSRRYWCGVLIGAIILAGGLWLGVDYLVCFVNPSGAGPTCTFGSIEANEVVGWGIIVAGAVVLVASVVGMAWPRRKIRINVDTKGGANVQVEEGRQGVHRRRPSQRGKRILYYFDSKAHYRPLRYRLSHGDSLPRIGIQKSSPDG